MNRPTMPDDEPIVLLLRALRFAADKHRDQRRKDTHQSPYVNHLIQVVELLCTVGGVQDGATLAAAALHDTLEDTATTAAELESWFGADVAALVMEVTDDRRLPQATRKQLQIECAAHASPRAKLIKIADKCCNLADIVQAPPATWSLERRREYAQWCARVMAGLRGTNAALEAAFDERLHAAQRALGLNE